MFVGGEFYADRRWIAGAPNLATEGMLFLNGGRACLTVIGDYLLDHGIDRVLLPSYLCPSILNVFERIGLRYDFYQVNHDLSIDLEDLTQKANGYQAVYFINYFGFLHAPETRAYLDALHQKDILVIEDNAQAGFHNHPTGDFIFNSLRKLAAHDGGYLIAQKDVTAYLHKYSGRLNRRLPVIREYRQRLYGYLFEGQGEHAALEGLFAQAEEFYEADGVVLGDPREREEIERLDWKGIQQVRRENYEYLLSLIAPLTEITPIYPALQPENMPLGLPVYFSDGGRDRVNQALGEAGIGLTIHWEDILAHPRTRLNPTAVDMASRMLTLTIDQRTSLKQLDYLAFQLYRALR